MNMPGKKKNNVLLLFCLISFLSSAQKVAIYKIDQLLKRINNSSDTVYVVNFWATWCKPCVEELPAFEKVNLENKSKKVKVLLVSMDFKEDVKKTVSFLKKHNYTAECVLLDELNGNSFIDKVDTRWGGAIPATLFTRQNKEHVEFFEKKLDYEALNFTLNSFIH
jgi:thiol-disulfide isomerase/thioredoxin